MPSRSAHDSLAALAEVLLPPGHGIPDANESDVAGRVVARMETWSPKVRSRVSSLFLVWELMPLASRHRARFSKMAYEDRQGWVASCYRSRLGIRRLMVAALKQVVMLTWASSSEAEVALGYDYRCRRDDEAHGTLPRLPRVPLPQVTQVPQVSQATAVNPPPPEPSDLHRPGPAVTAGAIPLRLLERRDHEHRTLPPLRTEGWPELFDGQRIQTEVVVIGSGAGGAVAAATLAEAGVPCIVVEEGRQVGSEDFQGPVFDRLQSFCRDHASTQLWGSPPIPLPLGKVVGGTTVVNSGTCFRPPERVLIRWRQEHGVDVSPETMNRHFGMVEDFLNVRPVPWSVLGFNGEAAHRGAVALGLTGGPLLRNIADCHGCGQCAFGCPTDAKQAMHVSYLPRAQAAGARVLARCRVERIEHERGRATGVEATLLDDRGRRKGRIFIAASQVVVSAGAIMTPVLLEGSRIPDPSQQTGRNLRVHPATGVGGLFPDEDVVSWKGTLQSYYIDSLFDSHEIMFEATATVPGVGAGSLPGFGAQAMADLANMRKIATLGFYVSDTSSGRVRRLRSGEPFATYSLNGLDTKRIGLAIATAAEILFAAGAKRVYPGLPGIDAMAAAADVDQLKERTFSPGHLRLTAFHPMGTVRMGADPARSVVDARGKHHSVEGLWVADASIFPTCVGVNPQITIMGFARAIASEVARELGAAGEGPSRSPERSRVLAASGRQGAW